MGNDISAAQGKLSFGRKIAYGLGDVGASCSNLMFASYFLVYCTNCLGIAASTASVILLAARVFDIVNDSWWGNWTDNKSNCEFGKYRKQMLTWIIPAIIFTCLMFSCPSGLAGSTVAVIWATVMYFAWTFCFSGWNCAYTGLSAVITPDHKERGSAASWRTGLMMLANIVIVAVVTDFTAKYGENSSTGWLWAVITLSIAGLIICAVTVFGSKEVISVEPAPKGEQDGIIKNISTCLHNKQFMICAIVSIAVGVAVNGRNGVMAYYFIYITHDYTAISIFATTFCLGGMAGNFLVPVLCKSAEEQREGMPAVCDHRYHIHLRNVRVRGKCSRYAVVRLHLHVLLRRIWHDGRFLRHDAGHCRLWVSGDRKVSDRCVQRYDHLLA